MAALHLPFQAKDMASLYKRVTKGDFKPIPRQYSDQLREVIGNMLCVRARERISLRKYNGSPHLKTYLYFNRGHAEDACDLTDRKRLRLDGQFHNVPADKQDAEQ